MKEWERRGSPTFDVNYLVANDDLYDPSRILSEISIVLGFKRFFVASKREFIIMNRS